MTSGYLEDAEAVLGRVFEENGYDEMISVRGVSFTSLCEHHLLPFSGTATVGCAGSAESGERALRVSVDAALRAGIFKASGSFDPMGLGDGRRKGLPRP